jgi:Ankyrin repeats (3 copies)
MHIPNALTALNKADLNMPKMLTNLSRALSIYSDTLQQPQRDVKQHKLAKIFREIQDTKNVDSMRKLYRHFDSGGKMPEDDSHEALLTYLHAVECDAEDVLGIDTIKLFERSPDYMLEYLHQPEAIFGTKEFSVPRDNMLHVLAALGCKNLLENLCDTLSDAKYTDTLKNALQHKNEAGNTPLDVAHLHENNNCHKLLINHAKELGLDLSQATPTHNLSAQAANAVRSWSFHELAAGGSTEHVRAMLEMKCHVDSRDSDGNTALHIAAQHGHGGILQVLINAGADVTVKNRAGQTAMMLADQAAHKHDQNGDDATAFRACMEILSRR